MRTILSASSLRDRKHVMLGSPPARRCEVVRGGVLALFNSNGHRDILADCIPRGQTSGKHFLILVASLEAKEVPTSRGLFLQ